MTEQSTETRLALLEDSIPRIERNTTRILSLLEGNGSEDGLKTSVALNSGSISRIWKVIGFGGSGIVTIISGFIVKLLVF